MFHNNYCFYFQNIWIKCRFDGLCLRSNRSLYFIHQKFFHKFIEVKFLFKLFAYCIVVCNITFIDFYFANPLMYWQNVSYHRHPYIEYYLLQVCLLHSIYWVLYVLCILSLYFMAAITHFGNDFHHLREENPYQTPWKSFPGTSVNVPKEFVHYDFSPLPYCPTCLC